ncbi:MAG TPA: twin-arginine translocation signal domain-containing protein [Candidatus Binatia bacterium]|nr:twin-arginine translocation signal domain-containing protein [Candidatus Binatia bacterium]
MAELTRRRFLQTSAGIAGAAAGLTTLGALRSGRLPSGLGLAGQPEVAAPASVMAYVRASSTGEVRLMVGERSVTVQDPELVRRLVKAAG